jgi:hypothetical protein
VKKCPYCGKEYGDEVAVCATDATPLFEVRRREPPPASEDAEEGGVLNAEHPTGSGGLVKFDRTTPLEKLFQYGTVLMGLLVFWTLMRGLTGYFNEDSGHYHPPQTKALLYLPIQILGLLAFWAARASSDNYYLVDPVGHCVFYHFKFLWFGSTRLLLNRSQILVVTTKGRKASDEGPSYWEYRMVVVSASGHELPLSDWRQEGLNKCNAQGARLARMLDCQYHKSQPRCEVRVRVKDGAASVKCAPLWLGMTRLDRWCLGILIGLVAAGAAALMKAAGMF